MCWRASLRWPLVVSMDVGRCLRNSLDVRPGQVVKYPASMALHLGIYNRSETGPVQELYQGGQRVHVIHTVGEDVGLGASVI